MFFLFWLIVSYFIGSLPSGYLISKWSRGINILRVGRKQIGATNTFYYAGQWQGIITGILDVAKGLIVIFGAKRFGFSSEIQALAGLAAVAGHNWSYYLKFAGGRGVATTLGVVLALDPIIFGWALIPFAVLLLLWDGAPGILLFLVTTFSLAISFERFIPVGLFSLLVFSIILIKRLNGAKERKLIINRLLFDRPRGPRAFPRWREKN